MPTLAPTSRARSAALPLALLCLSLSFPLCHVALANPAKPSWSTKCESAFTHCSAVESYENWEKESGEVTFNVHARMVDWKEGTTLWYVGDRYSPQLAELTADAGVNLVWFRPRGSRDATPSLDCPREELDALCQPTAKCREKLRNIQPGTFSFEQTAKDLNWAISSLNQPMKPIIVLGEGFSTAVVMRYLKQNANTTAVASILVNPVNPLLHNHFFNQWDSYDHAMRTLLHLCDENTACSARLGATEGAWERLLNILSAARQSHLPCQQKLGWGKGTAFETAVRNQLAAMLLPASSLFAPSDPGLTSLIPAFLYRLQRCNEADVKALKTLREKTIDAVVKVCPEDVMLRWLWLANEFTPDSYKEGKQGPPSVGTLISAARNSRSIVPLEATMNVFSDFYSHIPKYVRKNDENTLPYTRTKILIIHSDLDPVLPLAPSNGLALSYADAATQFRHLVGRAGHLPASQAVRLCLVNNLKKFKDEQEWAGENECNDVASTVNGGISFFGGNANLYFGAEDAWDFTTANAAEPPEGRLIPETSVSIFVRVVKKILRVLLWLVVAVVVVGLGYMAYTRWSFSRTRIADDFYDNLQPQQREWSGASGFPA